MTNMIQIRDKTDKVINYVAKLVMNGVFRSGDKIHSENMVAKKLSVSRTTVREVYAALEILGLVRSRQGEGTYLTRPCFEKSPKALSLITLILQGNGTEIMETRRIIEIGAVEIACNKRGPDNVIKLKRYLERMERCQDPYFLAEEDMKLHMEIIYATQNNLLQNLIQVFSPYIKQIAESHWCAIMKDGDFRTYSVVLDQHQRLVQAIEEGKATLAHSVMETHLFFAEERLKKKYFELIFPA